MKTLSRLLITSFTGNRRGIALVYVALLLVALLAFVGLAIDIGYMYVAKSQLQNAADSAALAGASKAKSVGNGTANPNDLVQSEARTEAISFAAMNSTAQSSVTLSSDSSNTLSNSNDITVGNWNSETRSYSANSTPVNAVQVRPRRTASSPGGEISLFISRVFGWDKMGVSADAIAALPVRATGLIAMCVNSCAGKSSDPNNPTILSPPILLDRDPSTPVDQQFAWTSLIKQTTSTTQITELVCSEFPNDQVCGKPIYTSQGTSSAGFKDFEAVFNDPNWDRENKIFSGSEVDGWWIMVPITESCPVTSQGIGNGTEPKVVVKYALIRVRSACDQGGGKGSLCRNFSTPNCKKINIDGTEYDSTHKIIIDRMACIDCKDISNSSGLKTILVK